MTAPFTIRPFDFGTVFAPITAAPEEATAAAVPAEAQLRIAALEAELAVLRLTAAEEVAAARAQGYDAGRADAGADQNAALLAAADAMHAQLEAVEAMLGEVADAAQRDAADVALAAAEMLAARQLEWAPAAAVDDAVGRALVQVSRGQEIQLRVHPDLLDAAEALITRRQAGDRRRLGLTAVGDAGVMPGDAQIAWDRGGLVLDARQRRAAVREALDAVLPAPPTN